jgi:hypothetical protein
MITRVGDALRAYPRRNPVTAAYLALLLATHLWLAYLAAPKTADTVLAASSTNLDNLARDPVGSLIASALFVDGPFNPTDWPGFGATAVTLFLGIGCALAWLERRVGALRAFGVFAAGHVGATLITAGVITVAIGQGWYPESVRSASDFGISYGAQAVLAATTFGLRRRLRPWWALGVLAWPLAGALSRGELTPWPDFPTVGHLTAAAIGFPLGAVLLGAGRGTAR